MLSAEAAGAYLTTYIRRYRSEYARLTAQQPEGAGFPDIVASPYLRPDPVVCYVATSGAAILSTANEPAHSWWVAGGPALMVDFQDPNSRVPAEVTQSLADAGLLGKSIGIYRVCFQETSVDDEVWAGVIPVTGDESVTTAEGCPKLDVRGTDLELVELLSRLTFGAYGRILDLGIAPASTDFWQPITIRRLGVTTADGAHHRWLDYLELLPHGDESAWDPRSAWVRAKFDVRRDLSHAFAALGRTGGMLSFPADVYDLDRFRDRLQALEAATEGLARLLEEQGSAPESIFQKYLEQHSLLLDVYGEVIPRPRFAYPKTLSPLGKTYVEPDFVIRRPRDQYTLVEIEKPAKPVATRQGQARAELTQASFQIGEFRDYVLEHYELLRDRFPGINRQPRSMVVISRSSERAFGGRADISRHLQLLREQLGVDEVLTYDDLVERARAAVARLAGLSPGA